MATEDTSPKIIIRDCETVDEATDIVEILTDAGIKREAVQIE